jgi:hypothetical protein
VAEGSFPRGRNGGAAGQISMAPFVGGWGCTLLWEESSVNEPRMQQSLFKDNMA